MPGRWYNLWMKTLTALILTMGLVAPIAANSPMAEIPLPNPIVTEKLYSAEDIACLRRNIYFEARGEGYQGMLAVAFVTVNRANDPRFPDTICDVVRQNRQFSWVHQRGWVKPNPIHPGDKKAWQTAIDIADQIAYGELDSNVGNATFFHTLAVKPSWRNKFKPVATIGNHIFYE